MMMFEIQWNYDDHLKLHSDCFLLVVIKKKNKNTEISSWAEIDFK
jgi:hypothetical protein